MMYNTLLRFTQLYLDIRQAFGAAHALVERWNGHVELSEGWGHKFVAFAARVLGYR